MKTTPESRNLYITQMGLLNYALGATTCLVAPQQGLDGLMPMWAGFAGLALVTASQMGRAGDTRPFFFRAYDCTIPFAHGAFGAAMASLAFPQNALSTLSVIAGTGMLGTLTAQARAQREAEIDNRHKP